MRNYVSGYRNRPELKGFIDKEYHRKHMEIWRRERKQLGYFEEFTQQLPSGTFKCLGVKLHDQIPPGRELGWNGRREFVFTEPVELTKGLKKVVYKASKTHPLVVKTTINPLEGRREQRT